MFYVCFMFVSLKISHPTPCICIYVFVFQMINDKPKKFLWCCGSDLVFLGLASAPHAFSNANIPVSLHAVTLP